MKLVALLSILCATGCLRVIDLDDDEAEVDALVLPVDAAVEDGAWDTNCAVPLPCPAPDSGKATICGWIHDAESDAVVAAENPTRQACSSTNPTTTGPCSLRVRYYDALDFAMNPGGAMPIEPESSVVDDCGRFRAHNMTRATFGFMGVAVDDSPGITPVTPHRLTGIIVPNALASPGIVRAYTTRVSTDQLWTAAAGLNQSFATNGVLLKVFTYRGVPRAGVTVRRNGADIPVDDYYFSDSGITRSSIAPAQTATGTNGSVLIINSDTPIAHDGRGAEPPGCQWPSNLGASTPGVVQVHIAEAETSAGAPCP